MTTKDLQDLLKKTRLIITDKLYQDIIKDAKNLNIMENDIKGVFDVVNVFYDLETQKDIYYGNNIVDYFEWQDALDYLYESVRQSIHDFYALNPKLLNDNFTLNNNFYFTGLRCFIVDEEDSLRQERQGK
jgi:hypothetical protein